MNVAGEGVGALSVRAVPKPQKRIKDKVLLRAMRKEITWCERCGRSGYIEAHHIKHRSQSGDDIRENLIRLCYQCHYGIHHANYDKAELIAIVAKREGKTAEEVAQAIGVVL